MWKARSWKQGARQILPQLHSASAARICAIRTLCAAPTSAAAGCIASQAAPSGSKMSRRPRPRVRASAPRILKAAIKCLLHALRPISAERPCYCVAGVSSWRLAGSFLAACRAASFRSRPARCRRRRRPVASRQAADEAGGRACSRLVPAQSLHVRDARTGCRAVGAATSSPAPEDPAAPTSRTWSWS